MAISPMQHLSLVLPTNLMDELLLSLQSEESVQIYDLSEQEDWQVAFQTSDGSKGSALRMDELRAVRKGYSGPGAFYSSEEGIRKTKRSSLVLVFSRFRVSWGHP